MRTGRDDEQPPGQADATDGSSSAGSFLRQVACAPHVEPPRVERDRAGEQLGRFQLAHLLGSGGMGVVYAAYDLTLKRKVALKLLRAEAVESEERRRRFVREARAAAAVGHPGIATVFDTGEVDGHLFIAMELVQGRSLRAALQAAGGALPAAEATRIARDIARGLAAAHDAGVIHRDIKPENVMLDGDGQVKILDFGLAKLHAVAGAAPDPAVSQTTHDGRILGTPSYMSPEQARGLPADARSDVFALGVVLFEMLAGRRPFGGATAMDVLAAIVRDEPPRLDARGVDVPDALAGVVSRCLAKDPGQRYQHAGALLAALSAAASPPVSALVRRWRRHRWRAVGISTAVTVTAACWLALRDPEPASRRPAADVSAPRPMAITDHPPPASRSPEAVTAYQAGLQAFRDANWGLAQVSLREAVRLDPSLAAAHLRLAISVSAPGGIILRPLPEAHAAYRQAMRLRSGLTPRDRALLAALEPIWRNESPELPEAARRLEALTAQYPHDAEIFQLLAVYSMLDTPERELAAARRAVELDPDYADAWQMVGGALAAEDPDAAVAAFERCTAAVPTAVDCWWMRAEVESARGRCAEAETLLRRATSDPGTSVQRFRLRAYMLHALGKPREAVEEVSRLPDTGWYTTAQIQNTSSALATVRLHAISATGGHHCVLFSLGAEESVTFRPDNPATPGTIGIPGIASSIGDWEGSMFIDSSQPLAAVVTLSNVPLDGMGRPGGTATAAYQGLSMKTGSAETGMALAYPLMKSGFHGRTNTLFVQNLEPWGDWLELEVGTNDGKVYRYATYVPGGQSVAIHPAELQDDDGVAMPAGCTGGPNPGEPGAGCIGAVRVVPGSHDSAQFSAITVEHPASGPAPAIQANSFENAWSASYQQWLPVVKNQYQGASTGIAIMNVSGETQDISLIITEKALPWVEYRETFEVPAYRTVVALTNTFGGFPAGKVGVARIQSAGPIKVMANEANGGAVSSYHGQSVPGDLAVPLIQVAPSGKRTRATLWNVGVHAVQIQGTYKCRAGSGAYFDHVHTMTAAANTAVDFEPNNIPAGSLCSAIFTTAQETLVGVFVEEDTTSPTRDGSIYEAIVLD